MPPAEQLAGLLEAWRVAPANPGTRRTRAQLWQHFWAGEALNAREQAEWRGLQALGVGDPAGMQIPGGEGDESAPTLAYPWALEGAALWTPYPPNWARLWALEIFLTPFAPGKYALTPPHLRLAVQRGPAEGLIAILESGLQAELSPEWVERIRGQPRLQVIPGPVLAFDDPAELLRLRENPRLRRELEQVLSPRHVALNPWAAGRTLEYLQGLGVLALTTATLPTAAHPAAAPLPGAGETRLGQADCAYLLALLWIAEGLPDLPAAPAGLAQRLGQGLPFALRAAAARQAYRGLQRLVPQGLTIEEELPPPPAADLLAAVQSAIGQQEALTVWYQTPGRPNAERRQITPLLIEQRSTRFYLIAYCHQRRANRQFRLDRMRLAGPDQGVNG
jgi:hypothetical protein